MKKKIRIIVLVFVAALIVADIIGGNALVTFAIARKDGVNSSVAPAPVTQDDAEKTIRENGERIRQETEEFLKTADRETLQITSDDGLTLEADLYLAAPDSRRYAILVHGYTGQRENMTGYAMHYAQRGFHVLTPDLRAHGKSEGRYIGMGWPDRRDILRWIDLILSREPEAEIVLHGVSMGAATVMMTAGEELPAQVKAVVEDCGYTSVWDIFSDEMDYLFHLPDFPLLYTASAFSRLRAGYFFGEASALSQISKTALPVLFIHGSEDNFVHTDMVYTLYDACPTEKELYITQGAGHGQSMSLDPEIYFDKVFTFLGDYLR